ncbi:hypothetical protein [Vulcanisaeta distributa]|uniref:hypothetical protein n=1 Tax=Vulcanisaeta distributa TaxID=164451 RepID=UPI0006CFAD9E|nr:hypothetical protein [Vulcanisaeta distributa]
MGVRDCISGGIRCSRYLGAFDCLIVHFWFHELELTVEFVINDDGLLDSLIVEGPIFRSPGNYVQVRFEVYTKYSRMYSNVIRGVKGNNVLMRVVCKGGVRRELLMGYGNEDFIDNPCRYAIDMRGRAGNPSDDLTLRIITNVMDDLKVASTEQVLNLLASC